MPPKKAPKQRDNQPKQEQKNRKEVNKDQEELRKVDVVLDKKFQVPLCYIKFFTEKKHKPKVCNGLIIITIAGRNIKNETKKYTKISWDDDDNPFQNKNLQEIESDLKVKYNTTCTTDDNSFVLFGSFPQIRKYLIEKYEIKNDKIRLNLKTSIVPPLFNIELHTKLGSYVTKISWCTTIWTDEIYKDFVEEFQLRLTDFKLKYDVKKCASQIEFTIYDYCIPQFSQYFKEAWHMEPEQIDIDEIPRDKEISPPADNANYQFNDPYNQMINKFMEFPEDSYFYQMSQTIQDSYKNDFHKFDRLEFNDNLVFKYSGSTERNTVKKIKKKNSDDEEEEIIEKEKIDFWKTEFNVLDRFNIDEIQNGFFLSKGDTVIITYKERNGKIKGTISSNKRGRITATFMLKDGELPPGVKASQVKDLDKEKDDEKKEEEEEDKENYFSKFEKEKNINNDDVINDDDDYNSDSDDENDKNAGDYTILFQPNDVQYRRSALGLLVLNQMPSTSPIKTIISNESFSKKINVINEDFEEHEIESKMKFESRYWNRLSASEKNILNISYTDSQKDCIKMILNHNISIVHGPPGCGKTFSIALFVYNLIRHSQHHKRKILLCAFSNQAVESIVKFVSPVVKALNKDIVWIAKKDTQFNTEEEYQNATEEQKCLSIYKIMNRRETEEVFQYKTLQKKKWEYKKILKMKDNKLRKTLLADKKKKFTESDYHHMENMQYKIEKNMIYEADVVCCTLNASGKSYMKCIDFDYIIIDEASQADQMASLIPLIHNPKKIVLLGDYNQLDSIASNELKIAHPLTSRSLYLKLHQNKIQNVMLKTQFRMNPLICKFPNEAFYDGQIISASNVDVKTKVNLEGIPAPITFVDVKDGEEEQVYGLTFKNEKEAVVIQRILKNFKKNKVPENQVGIITPYHEQLEILRGIAKKLNYRNVRISCVENFQGSECDFIILSMVRTNRYGNFGFITNKLRLNVSLTRARKGLIIVGNFARLSTRNRSKPKPENEIIIQLCEFYKNQKRVIDSNLIKELVKPVKKSEKNNDNDNQNEDDMKVEEVMNVEIVDDDLEMDQICENESDDDYDDDSEEKIDLQKDMTLMDDNIINDEIKLFIK